MEFSIKQRIYCVFFELFVAALAISVSLDGFSDFKSYLQFPDIIDYAPAAVFSLLSPLFFIPMLCYAISPILKGKKYPVNTIRYLTKLMTLGAIIAFIIAAIFWIWYLGELKDKEYIKCSNMPSSYTPGPGGATRYVLDKSLCHK